MLGLNRFGTLLAQLKVGYFPRPHPLVIAAWLWLAAEAQDIEEKRRPAGMVSRAEATSATGEPAT